MLKTAEKLHPNDKQRVVRALAVWYQTGKPISAFQGNAKPLIQPELSIALVTIDRQAHLLRFKQRLDAMLSNGFEQEIETLMQRPNLNQSSNAMRSVGYKQWWAYKAGQISRQQAYDQTIIANHQLAKHQRTWLNRFHNIKQFDVLNSATMQELEDISFIENNIEHKVI